MVSKYRKTMIKAVKLKEERSKAEVEVIVTMITGEGSSTNVHGSRNRTLWQKVKRWLPIILECKLCVFSSLCCLCHGGSLPDNNILSDTLQGLFLRFNCS